MRGSESEVEATNVPWARRSLLTTPASTLSASFEALPATVRVTLSEGFALQEHTDSSQSLAGARRKSSVRNV